MPLNTSTENIFSDIIDELEKMKNLYSYSNNNEFYNSVIDMCIGKVMKIKEKNVSETQTLLNEQETSITDEEQSDNDIPLG